MCDNSEGRGTCGVKDVLRIILDGVVAGNEKIVQNTVAKWCAERKMVCIVLNDDIGSAHI